MYGGFSQAEEQKTDSELIKTLMSKSGMNTQLEQMPELIKAGMVEANKETEALSPEALTEVSGMAAMAFDPERLQSIVQQYIQTNLDEHDTRQALAWLGSPLGEKIIRLEEKAATPEGYADMFKMADQLVANSVRVELIKKLDDAVKATETAVSMAVNTQAALIAGLTSTMKPGNRPSMEAIENEVAKNKEQIRSEIEPRTILMFLYSYRELNDAEIGQYLKFARSNAGKKYHETMSSGFNDALARAARALGVQIEHGSGQEVKDLKKKSTTAGPTRPGFLDNVQG